MSFALFLLACLFVVYGYFGIRAIQPFGLSKSFKALLWFVLFILLLLPPCSIYLRMNGMENRASEIVSWAGYLSMGYILLSCTFILMRDLLSILLAAARFLRRLLGGRVQKAIFKRTDPERRVFITKFATLGVLSLSGALTAYGFFLARNTPRVVEVPVYFSNLPESLENFKIVQIADIHVSPTLKGGFVEKVVERVNGTGADIVVLTGDLVDGSVEYLRRDVAPLAKLKGPLGLFFVTGNHEYYSGVLPWIEEIGRLGFTVLINEHRVVEKNGGKILVAGVTDYRAGAHLPLHKSSPSKALEGSPPCDLKILLAHQPMSIREAAEAKYDFQISGHTHGGQFFPGNFVFEFFYPYVSGLHDHDGTQIYVSRGTGYWGPPLRLGAPPEITLFTLKRAVGG